MLRPASTKNYRGKEIVGYDMSRQTLADRDDGCCAVDCKTDQGRKANQGAPGERQLCLVKGQPVRSRYIVPNCEFGLPAGHCIDERYGSVIRHSTI